jgi:hypothetical protein
MRLGIVAFVAVVLAVTATAQAAPLVTVMADLTGTGTSDAIDLGDDGVLHIRTGATTSDVRLARGLPNAKIEVGPVNGKPAIVVHEMTATGEVGYIIVHAQQWQVAWRSQDGELGPVGLDGEYSQGLEANPTGVLRFQARPGVARCDRKPAYLFAEQFDGKDFVKAKRVPVNLDPAAPGLVAKPDPDPATPPIGFHAKWASSQRGAANAGELARPTEIDDGKPGTVWHFASDGEGEFVTFSDSAKHAAVQLRILPGDQRSPEALRRAARPQRLAIVTEQGVWRVDLPDAAKDPLGTAYVVDLPIGITRCATVVVASSYPGSEPLAISELAVYVQGERGGGGDALLAGDVAADAEDAKSAAAQLVRHGAAALPAIDAELARLGDAGARRRLVAVLVGIHDPATVPLLRRAAEAGWVDGDAAIAVTHALGELGATTELHDLAKNKDLPGEIRIAAAAALDAMTPSGFGALADLAGIEPRGLRRVVIDRLARAVPVVLVSAAKAASTAAAAGDLWRATVRAARAGDAAARSTTLAELQAALPSATEYERRYRLVDGIATLGAAADLTALAAEIGKVGGAEATVLRQVAAIAIGATPRSEALELVLALTHDDDAGVRLTALKAFMQATDAHGSDPWGTASVARIDQTTAALLTGDSWPDVRKQAAYVLGKRCQRPEPVRALVAAVAHDPTIGVRGDALQELAACHAPVTAELIAKIFDDDRMPLELRTRAIGLAILLGDPRLAAQLVARFDSWRGKALGSADAVSLAVEAANAIGRLAPPGAALALESALEDGAFPEIVGAAATALGTLGPACPAAARAKLGALAASDDTQVSVPARHAQKLCGKSVP